MKINRREFLFVLPFLSTAPAWLCAKSESSVVHTVDGPIDSDKLGVTLMHEHVMVDFIGADKVSRARYDADKVFEVALPHLKDLKSRGCTTLVECTPDYLGRDPLLLRRLSKASGLNLLTNTGYYAAAQNKFVPAHAYRETADALAARWVREFKNGIEDTGIKPGFMKIGVDAGPLSEIGRKLITAAARCHLQTGLTIHVHTGNGAAAMEIIDTLKREKVSPNAYVWVHAQNEKDRDLHRKAAEVGAWVEFDGVSERSLDAHVDAVLDLIGRGHLDQLLVSQDAGWYHVGEPGGGNYRGYTFLFDNFLPALRKKGVSESQIKTLMVLNPARALAVQVRKADR
jgi:phosphotriesterase-related protein